MVRPYRSSLFSQGHRVDKNEPARTEFIGDPELGLEASQIGSASGRNVALFIGGVFPKESLLPRACMISPLVPLWPETPSHSGQAYTCRGLS